jgi:hypothetical protein
MEEVWHGPPYTLPFLYVGTWRRIMFPESGRNVPFQIQNYAYLDPLGRETVTWVRTFRANRQRRFDAYMIYSEQRSCIIDYLGTHQHLAVDMELGVAPNGGLRLRSGAQRFYEGSIAFPFPQLFSGIADVCEWYDDAEREFKIEVNVKFGGDYSATRDAFRWIGRQFAQRTFPPTFFRTALRRGNKVHLDVCVQRFRAQGTRFSF